MSRMRMNARLVLGLVALALAGLVAPGGAQPPFGQPFAQPQRSGGNLRVRVHTVYDQEGFGQPVPAYRLVVPVDWQVQTALHWKQEGITCGSNLIEARARLIAPDGITALEIFPQYGWRWVDDPQIRAGLTQSDPGCPWLPYLTAPDYLNFSLPRVRPGARVVRATPDDRVRASMEASLRMQLAQSLQAGYLRGVRVDAGRFNVSYLLNGRPVDELVTGVLQVLIYPSPWGKPTFGVVAQPWIAARAPQGGLEPMLPLFATLVASITPDLYWTRAIQLVTANLANIAREGGMARQRIWHQAQQEIGQIYVQAWQNQQRVQSSLAQQYSDSVRGIERFRDPIRGEPVELPGGYAQAWSNHRGEYILSNDPNFNPAVALRENWQQMPREGR